MRAAKQPGISHPNPTDSLRPAEQSSGCFLSTVYKLPQAAASVHRRQRRKAAAETFLGQVPAAGTGDPALEVPPVQHHRGGRAMQSPLCAPTPAAAAPCTACTSQAGSAPRHQAGQPHGPTSVLSPQSKHFCAWFLCLRAFPSEGWDKIPAFWMQLISSGEWPRLGDGGGKRNAVVIEGLPSPCGDCCMCCRKTAFKP